MRFALVAAATVALGGCTQLDNAIASVPYLAMMRNAPFFDPYEAPLPPPPGSIPYESPAGVHMPPQEATEDALNAFAASNLAKNPYAHDDTTVLAFGKKMYERNCSVCHGADGKGNGPIVGRGKFPMGPSLVISTKSEGYMYGIMRSGRGLMPSYGARVNHSERWAIATYVLHLQAQGGNAGATTPAAGAAPAGAAPAGATTGSSAAPAATTTSGQENR
jgi:mono/diheme cytochrome c family protein